MIYKIVIGKEEVFIDEEEKNFITHNQDKRFIELKTGELINIAFIQGIFIDEGLSRAENKNILSTLDKNRVNLTDNTGIRENYDQKDKTEIKKLGDLLSKYNRSLTTPKNNG